MYKTEIRRNYVSWSRYSIWEYGLKGEVNNKILRKLFREIGRGWLFCRRNRKGSK